MSAQEYVRKMDKSKLCRGFSDQVAAFILSECLSTADESVQLI